MKKYYIIIFIALSTAFLLIGFALFYALVMKPSKEERVFADCLEIANGEYERKRSEINKEIKSKEEKINEIKPEIEEEVSEIFTLSPEPPKPPSTLRKSTKEMISEAVLCKYCGTTKFSDGGVFCGSCGDRIQWYEWYRKVKAGAEEIEKPLRELEWDIERLKKDLEIILVEKEDDEDNCYRRYK